MKRLISFLLLFLIFSVTICFHAIDVSAYIEPDGTVNRFEWEECDPVILLETHQPAESCYHLIYIRYKYIQSDNRIYIAVVAENENGKFSDNPSINEAELYFSFDNSSEITIRSDGTAEYSEEDFYVRHGSHHDNFGNVYYEAETVLKENRTDEKLTMYIQLKDHENNLTRVFETDITSTEDKTSTTHSGEVKGNVTSRKPHSNKNKETTVRKTEESKKMKTEIITQSYDSYSDELRKSNIISLAVGTACVVVALGAMCVVIFKKNKQ